MKLIETIKQDLLDAMHDRDTNTVSTLRLLIATVEKKKVEKKLKVVEELSDADIIDAISKNIKQVTQEMESLVRAGRVTYKQEAEKLLLTSYLPKQMTEEEIRAQTDLIVTIVKDAGGNIGIAMAEASSKMKGKADMKLVSQLVREGMNR